MADDEDVVAGDGEVTNTNDAETKTVKPKPPKPPIPTLFTIAAVLVAVALIGGAYLLGRDLGTSSAPSPSPSPTPPPTMPDTLAGYTLTKSAEPSTPPSTDQQLVRGEYTDGSNQFVVLLTRPMDDLEKFMTDAGVTNLQAVDAGQASSPNPSAADDNAVPLAQMCGTSTDTGFAACGRIVKTESTGTTGQLVVAATKLTTDQVRELLGQISQ